MIGNAYNSKDIHGKSRETFDIFFAFKSFKKKRKVRRLCGAATLCGAGDYYFSSARNYAGLENDLDVVMLDLY